MSEKMEQRNGSKDAAETPRDGIIPPTRRDSEDATPRAVDSAAETPRPQHQSDIAPPPAKRLKANQSRLSQREQPRVVAGNNPDTPVILAETPVDVHALDKPYEKEEIDLNDLPKTPATALDRQPGTGGTSSPSDLSASSRSGRDASLSPVTPFVPEVPPAPPSTPASDYRATISSSRFEGLSTPLPYSAVKNADKLEQQQLLSEGAVTPAPTKPEKPPKQKQQALTDDFSEWAVGDRYQLLRMLGRGSYGEVAQALDLYQGRSDAYVAIKRIQSPFDQEVDAVRLFREIHILRRLRGHECIIQLLDIVEPPSEESEMFVGAWPWASRGPHPSTGSG